MPVKAVVWLVPNPVPEGFGGQHVREAPAQAGCNRRPRMCSA